MSILITGATGNIGMDVLKTLQQHGSSHIKALVRIAAKDASVARFGATPVRGQFDDRASLSQAMDGVETLVLITPAHPQAVAYASAALAVAKETGVQKIVRVSAIKADPKGPTNNTRAHGQTEAEIVQSGLRYVMLRPNLFMQNMFMALEPIKTSGQLSFAMGAGKMGMIDTRDIAACAARCVLSEQWDGDVMELTGPASVSYDDVAATLSELCKKTVTYTPTAPDDMYAMIADAGWGEWMAALTRDYGKAYTSGWGDFTTDHVERVTGRPPRSFKDFATDTLVPLLG